MGGGVPSFHFRRISHLAIGDAKAIAFDLFVGNFISSSIILNNAVRGYWLLKIPNTSEKVLKTSPQYLLRRGQDQRVWIGDPV